MFAEDQFVSLMLFVKGEIDYAIDLRPNDEMGTSVEINIDDTLRRNFPLGLTAMAFHALLVHYTGRGGIDEHWAKLMPLLYDAIEANETAVGKELALWNYYKDEDDVE